MTPDIIAALEAAQDRLTGFFERNAWTKYSHPASPFKDIALLAKAARSAALSTSPTGQDVREDKTTFCADLVRRWETEWRNSNSIHWGDCLSWNSAREIAIRLDAALSSVEPAGNGREGNGHD